MTARGLFITLEGGEGVGKSTNLGFLAGQLEARGIDLIVTREPGGTECAEAVRRVLLEPREEPLEPLAELLLLFAGRAQHLHRLIEPSLRRGQWVLCDRFTDATYAYQCGGRGLPAEQVQILENLVQGDLRPDCTILLDAPVATGVGRMQARGEPDRFERESEAFFERVRSLYLQLARESSGRYRVIDAARPLQAVQSDLGVVVEELYSAWRARHGGAACS